MTFESHSDAVADTWFLAQLKPNSIQIAERNLHRQGFTTFTPMLEETRQRRGKFVRAATTMFPGYTFVAKDETARWWRAINSTYGVSRLVSFGGALNPGSPPYLGSFRPRWLRRSGGFDGGSGIPAGVRLLVAGLPSCTANKFDRRFD